MNIRKQIDEFIEGLSPGECIEALGIMINDIERETEKMSKLARQVFNIPICKIDISPTENYKPIVKDAVIHHNEGFDIIPSNLDLSSMETRLVNAMSREKVLDNLLKSVKNDYDYILIDCMPSRGMLTINALTAADSVIIPVQAQYLPAKGMTQLMKSIDMVRSHTNEELKIEGIVMTLVDGRTNLAKDVINAIRTNYGMSIRIFDSQIPVGVKAAEASKTGQSLFVYDHESKPAKAYEALTKEVIADVERKRKRDKAAVTR